MVIQKYVDPAVVTLVGDFWLITSVSVSIILCHLEHELDDNTLAFTDYLDNPTEHRFNFSKVTENEIVVIINNLKTKNYSRKDEISNQFENSGSELLEIVTEIPQGSILGPLFFSICINDLVKSSNKFQFLMYAEDVHYDLFNLDKFSCEKREITVNNELEKVNT